MKLFNWKRNELILEPNELLKGVEGVSATIYLRNLYPDLPFVDKEVVSGGFLEGLDIPLGNEKEISESKGCGYIGRLVQPKIQRCSRRGKQ